MESLCQIAYVINRWQVSHMQLLVCWQEDTGVLECNQSLKIIWYVWGRVTNATSRVLTELVNSSHYHNFPVHSYPTNNGCLLT